MSNDLCFTGIMEIPFREYQGNIGRMLCTINTQEISFWILDAAADEM